MVFIISLASKNCVAHAPFERRSAPMSRGATTPRREEEELRPDVERSYAPFDLRARRSVRLRECLAKERCQRMVVTITLVSTNSVYFKKWHQIIGFLVGWN